MGLHLPVVSLPLLKGCSPAPVPSLPLWLPPSLEWHWAVSGGGTSVPVPWYLHLRQCESSPRQHNQHLLALPAASLAGRLQTPKPLLLTASPPLLTGGSPVPGPFLPLLPLPPSENEAARSLAQTRLWTLASPPPSEKEAAPPLLPARFGPLGSTSSTGLPMWSRGPPETLGHGVGCRSSDSGAGARCPAAGNRTRRKPHGSDGLPLAIPSVGGSRGRLAGAGREHR